MHQLHYFSIYVTRLDPLLVPDLLSLDRCPLQILDVPVNLAKLGQGCESHIPRHILYRPLLPGLVRDRYIQVAGHLEQFEGETFGPELVLRGARERMAPILMTALATGLALLPLVIGSNRAGTEMIQPMAIVILGGLVTSTLLNLFFIPILYVRFGYSPAAEQAPVLVEEGAPA